MLSTEQRKLSAIMFTDMVAYSALSQRNEALSLDLLEEHRGLLRALFPKYHGREVETTGDGFLVEFASALEAVRCAIEIQRTLTLRNVATGSERAIELRIGIHVGDVVHREGHVMELQRQGKNVSFAIAVAQHGLRNDLQALDELERDVEERASRLPELYISPLWKELRPHPRAQAILRKMNPIN